MKNLIPSFPCHRLSLILFTICLGFLASCQRASNQYSDTQFDCGNDFDNELTAIKIFDPQDQPVMGHRMLAAVFDESIAALLPLAVSSRGCVAIDDLDPQQRLVMASKDLANSWGKVIEPAQIGQTTKVKLVADQNELLPIGCDQEIITRNQGLIPLSLRDIQSPANFHVEAELGNAEFSAQGGVSGIYLDAGNLKDGSYQVNVEVTNLIRKLKGFADSSSEKLCNLVIDSTAPILEGPTDDAITKKPGEEIVFQYQDTLDVDVFVCLVEMGSEGCQVEDEFQVLPSKASLSVPNQGKWHLQFYAQDSTGNRTPATELALFVVDQDKINGIRREINLNRLVIDADPIAATTSALDMVDRYLSLATAEEKEQVETLLALHLLQVANQATERWVTVLDSLQNIYWLNGRSNQTGYYLLQGRKEILVYSSGHQLCGRIPTETGTQVYLPEDGKHFYTFQSFQLPESWPQNYRYLNLFAVDQCQVTESDPVYLTSLMTSVDEFIIDYDDDLFVANEWFDPINNQFLFATDIGIYSYQPLSHQTLKLNDLGADVPISSGQVGESIFLSFYDLDSFSPQMTLIQGSDIAIKSLDSLPDSGQYSHSMIMAGDSEGSYLIFDDQCHFYRVSGDTALAFEPMEVEIPKAWQSQDAPCQDFKKFAASDESSSFTILQFASALFKANLEDSKITIEPLYYDYQQVSITDWDNSTTSQILGRREGNEFYEHFRILGNQLILVNVVQPSKSKTIETTRFFRGADSYLVSTGSQAIMSSLADVLKPKTHLFENARFLGYYQNKVYTGDREGSIFESDFNGNQMIELSLSEGSIPSEVVKLTRLDQELVAITKDGAIHLWSLDSGTWHFKDSVSNSDLRYCLDDSGTLLTKVNSDVWLWGKPSCFGSARVVEGQWQDMQEHFILDTNLVEDNYWTSVPVNLASGPALLTRHTLHWSEFNFFQTHFELLTLPNFEPVDFDYGLASTDHWIFDSSTNTALSWTANGSVSEHRLDGSNKAETFTVMDSPESSYPLMDWFVSPDGSRVLMIYPDYIYLWQRSMTELHWTLQSQQKLTVAIDKIQNEVFWHRDGVFFIFNDMELAFQENKNQLFFVGQMPGQPIYLPEVNSLVLDRNPGVVNISLDIQFLTDQICNQTQFSGTTEQYPACL